MKRTCDAILRLAESVALIVGEVKGVLQGDVQDLGRACHVGAAVGDEQLLRGSDGSGGGCHSANGP
jgi:hypothetical protein